MARPTSILREPILGLWATGAKRAAIAAELGCSEMTVSHWIGRARQEGDPRVAALRYTSRSRIKAEAALRGTTVRKIERQLLRIIEADNLYRAILGDPE